MVTERTLIVLAEVYMCGICLEISLKVDSLWSYTIV